MPPCCRSALHLVSVAALLASPFLPLRGASWPEIPAAELAANSPVIDPDAAAEFLIYEETIDDTSNTETAHEVYVRVKLFSRAGVERYSVIDVPFVRGESWVRSIEARTVKPDGTVLLLNPKEVYEREVVRTGTVRKRVKSFAPPGLEPGAILEYRIRFADTRVSYSFFLAFNRDAPVRRGVFRFRPYGASMLRLQAVFMNTDARKLTANSAGYFEFEQANVPALPDEPLPPVRSTIASTVLLYYTYDPAIPPDRYWKEQSRSLLQKTKQEAKATKEITQLAQRLVAGGATVEEKLQRLHDFCRTDIVNRERPEPGSTEPRGRIESHESAARTLKTSGGTRADINALFVALARAAGFDARLASANDRSYFPARRELAVPFIFTDRVAVVKVGEQWQFFDPGAALLPAGVLDWRNTDTHALVADDVERIIPVAGSPAAFSSHHRTARLELLEDGTLEGEVVWRYTGHCDAEEKNALRGSTAAEIEARVRSSLEPTLKGLEVSEVKVLNAERLIEPLEISCRVHVPAFAERTGTRLFVQPSVFRRNAARLFPEPKRSTPIIYPYRTSERDTVEIVLPEGFSLEAGHSPGDLSLGEVGHYGVVIRWDRGDRRLSYERTFTRNVIAIPAKNYGAWRDVLDAIQDKDNHTLTFRETAASGAADPAN